MLRNKKKIINQRFQKIQLILMLWGILINKFIKCLLIMMKNFQIIQKNQLILKVIQIKKKSMINNFLSKIFLEKEFKLMHLSKKNLYL